MAAGHMFAFLILLNSNTGFSAGDTVYVETGDSVQLDIQREKLPAKFVELFWQNDKSDTLVKYYNKFKYIDNLDPERVDFNNKTLSITLNNMQKTDSGVYTAQIPGKPNRDIAVHKVSVIDAVEAPVLTVISNSSSSDSCTVNFTCTGHDLTLNSTYTNGRCSPEKVTSQEKYTIILICSDTNIICNHNNPVSLKKDETDIKQFCKAAPEKPGGLKDTSNHSNLVIGVVGCVVLVLAGLALAGYFWRKRRKGGQQDLNTIYEGVGNQPMETIKTEPHTYDIPDWTLAHTQEGKESSTIYHMVGQHPSQPVTAVTEHTIYSQVCKQPPAKRPDTTSSNNTRKQTEDCG